MLDPILFEEIRTDAGPCLGLATLNAEKSLNALTLTMIQQLQAQLSRWEQDDNIVAVVLRGAGDKAFCAGGDVRALYHALLTDSQHPSPYAINYFTAEYQLDYQIHRYPKPLVVWGNGIVMGGGLGLLAGASHRIVTPSSRLAMPEITIGLYPDVAASWFLQRMPAKLGLFLGLTAAPLNAHDALLCNLADYVLASDDWDNLLAHLTTANWRDSKNHQQLLSTLLDALSKTSQPDLPVANSAAHWLTIHQLMQQGSLQAVASSLQNQQFTDPWLANAANSFSHGSPTSAALIWEIFQRAKHLSLAEALRMEFTLTINCCAKPDLTEGIRALLIDKDRSPRWHYPDVNSVPADEIARYFHSP
ncbi:enoyl-CoA hydratase/isomerase family protein [Neisseriaceae bacterium TC5R-5]|nr:enoyl-CoA hydratase/isomerase family protein [Neisseriaceae bacterium TC5R-5]